MLEGEIGHIYQYNLSIEASVRKLGWKFIGYVPANVSIENLPYNWEKTLPKDTWQQKKRFNQKIHLLIQNIFSYRAIFKKASKNNSIIFLEHFSLIHLLAIFAAICFSRSNISLWLLHRYFPSGKKKYLLRLIHWGFSFFLGRKNVKLFTDSELLSQKLQIIFDKKVVVLPIPHAKIPLVSHKQSQKINLWWPGGSIRQEKGIHEITKVIHELPYENFQLILAKKAKETLYCTSDSIVWIPTELTRKEYEKWMNTADFILLPYDPKTYALGTSGIFVEAILAQKLPIVKEGSWLAHELKRFNLNDLIIDWDKGPILSQLEPLLHKKEIHEKLMKMHSAYASYHCLENISGIFKSLIDH
jgi:hypothetical protein